MAILFGGEMNDLDDVTVMVFGVLFALGIIILAFVAMVAIWPAGF